MTRTVLKVHLPSWIAEGRRVRPDEGVAVGLRRPPHFLVGAALEVGRAGHEGQDHGHGRAHNDPFPVQAFALPFANHKRIRIPVNASSDNNGIGTEPAI